MKFFCDTYALIEIIRGNKNYQKYLDEELFTSLLNLYELFYNLLKEFDEAKAKEFFYQFFPFVYPLHEEHLFAASRLKLRYKAHDLSYADALGYALAYLEGMRFLTGDKEFKEMENVEYVK